MFYKILDFLNDLRPRQIFLLAGISTVIMFATVYLIFSALTPHVEEPQNVEQQPKYTTENVVVVKSDIAARTVFTEDMLQVKQVPEDLVPEGAITNLRSIVGQSAGVTMYAGDIVTEQKIHIESFTSSFVDSIPKDCRAVSVGIGNVTGVAGFAKAGDFVDVILVQKNDQSANSRLILQNVLLLSINKNAGEDITSSVVPKIPSSAGASLNTTTNVNQSSEQEPEDPVIATLALKPQETMELVSAAALGEIYLALRPQNPSEMTVGETNYTMYGLTNSPASVTRSNIPTTPVAPPVTANVPSPAIPLPPSTTPASGMQGTSPPNFEIIKQALQLFLYGQPSTNALSILSVSRLKILDKQN